MPVGLGQLRNPRSSPVRASVSAVPSFHPGIEVSVRGHHAYRRRRMRKFVGESCPAASPTGVAGATSVTPGLAVAFSRCQWAGDPSDRRPTTEAVRRISAGSRPALPSGDSPSPSRSAADAGGDRGRDRDRHRAARLQRELRGDREDRADLHKHDRTAAVAPFKRVPPGPPSDRRRLSLLTTISGRSAAEIGRRVRYGSRVFAEHDVHAHGLRLQLPRIVEVDDSRHRRDVPLRHSRT